MIQLIDDIYLDSDESCFMLRFWTGKTRENKSGESLVFENTKYYSNLDDLLAGLFKTLQKRDVQKAKDFTELTTLISRTTRFLRETTKFH